MRKVPTYAWNFKNEERGRKHANTIPTNHTLLQNPEVVGFLSNYMADPNNDLSIGLREIGRIYPLTAEPGEDGNYGWTPQRLADLIDKYKQMLKKDSEYTNAKNKAAANRDRAYAAAAKKQVVQAGRQNIGRGRYLRHSFTGGINMRKAYPNEIFHAVNSAYDYRARPRREIIPDRSSRPSKSSRSASSTRINSAADVQAYNYKRNRESTNNAWNAPKISSLSRFLNDAIEGALAQANAGERAMLTGGSDQLARFANQAKLIIQKQLAQLEANKQREDSNSTAAQKASPMYRQSWKVRKESASKYLGLTDATWSQIMAAAKQGLTYSGKR